MCLAHVHLYTPWYPRGSLYTAGQGLTKAERCIVLGGAWKGMAWLHTNGILHYGQVEGHHRVPPCERHQTTAPRSVDAHRPRTSNILIQDPLDGVIGDIDDVMFKHNCNPSGPDILSTPGYGAPFKHCGRDEPRRVFIPGAIHVVTRWRWGRAAS